MPPIKLFSQVIQILQQYRRLSAVLLGGCKSIGDMRAVKQNEAAEANAHLFFANDRRSTIRYSRYSPM